MYQGQLQIRVTQAVGDYLQGMDRRGELVPGAAENLFNQVLSVKHRGPEEGLTYLSELIETRCQHYYNPERQADESEAPLRAVLRRMPVKDGRADELYDELATRYGGMPPSQMAGAVWTYLNMPANHDNLVNPPGLAAKEREDRELEDRTREALEVFREWIDPSVDLTVLAARWAREVGRRSFFDAVQLVGDRLRMPHHATHLTKDGKPAKIPVERIVFDMKRTSATTGMSPTRETAGQPTQPGARLAPQAKSNLAALIAGGFSGI